MKRILFVFCATLLLVFASCEAVTNDESSFTEREETKGESSSHNESSCESSFEESKNDEISENESSSEDVSDETSADESSSDESTPDDEKPQPKPEHSELYIPGISVEDVILWFNEVVLDAEVTTGDGDATVVQKWDSPIRYYVEGETTDKDDAVFENFISQLNEINGFPGFLKAENAIVADLNIYYCPFDEFESHLNIDLGYVDGAVRFWYRNNVIYNATICYRNDINQLTRNSVILEEIYNGLGPAQDTKLRADSIIYSEFSEPQELTKVDWLILKLLYHPDIKCGMNVSQCEEVIRRLYY